MSLDVSQALKSPGEVFPFQQEVEIPPQEIYDEDVRFEGVRLFGHYSATGEDIVLHGVLSGIAKAACANCLEEAAINLEVPFSEVFLHQGDPEDLDVFLYTGSALELSRLAETIALLGLPMRILCRDDCKGVCPGCGGNLNKNQCLCHKQLRDDNPFAALKQLLDQDEEV